MHKRSNKTLFSCWPELKRSSFDDSGQMEVKDSSHSVTVATVSDLYHTGSTQVHECEVPHHHLPVSSLWMCFSKVVQYFLLHWSPSDRGSTHSCAVCCTNTRQESRQGAAADNLSDTVHKHRQTAARRPCVAH